MKKFSANPEKLAAVNEIAEILSRLGPDEVIKYENLDNMMMNDRNVLNRARRKVEKSHGYVFEAIYKVGVKRLSRRIVIVDSAVKKTSRLMNRTEKRVTNVLLKDGNSLTRHEKAELNSGISQINAIQLAVKLAKS